MYVNYKTVIEENTKIFEHVESEKNKFVKKAHSIKLSILGLTALAIAVKLFPRIVIDISPEAAVIICAVILALISLLLWWTNNESILPAAAKRNFYNTYKQQLMENIIKLISDQLIYKPQNRVLNRKIIESELFGKITEFRGRNYVYGAFDESEVHLSELRLMNGLSCVFEGFYVYVSNVRQENIDFATIRKLGGKWKTKDGNLYIAFSGMKKLFEVRIEKSNKSIERVKQQTDFLITVLSIASKAIGVELKSNYTIHAIDGLSDEEMR